MIREYEFTVITRGDLSDADYLKTIDKYEEIIKRDGGQVIHKDEWGIRKLAHPIDRQYRGRYVFYDIAAAPVNVSEAERLMRIDDNVLRYLTIKVADQVEVEKRREEIIKRKLEEKQRASEQRDDF